MIISTCVLFMLYFLCEHPKKIKFIAVQQHRYNLILILDLFYFSAVKAALEV